MKNLFKSLVICGLFALVGSFATSCTPDQTEKGESWRTGPASFAFTQFDADGNPEAIVNNAISVDIPVDVKNMYKLYYIVEEYVVNPKDGKEWVIDGYDANREPKYKRLLTKNPPLVQIAQAYRNRKGQMFEKVTALDKLHITGNQGLDRNRTFIVYIAGAISDKAYYNNGEVFTVKFKTPEKYDDDVTIIRESYEGMDVFVALPQEVKNRIATINSRATWGVTNIAVEAYNGPAMGAPLAPSPGGLYHNHIVYPAFFFKNDTLLEINHYNAYRRNAKGEIGLYETLGESVTECEPGSAEDIAGTASPIQYYYLFRPGEPLVLHLGEVYECTKENKLTPTMGFYVDNDGCGWYWFPYDIAKYDSDSMKDINIDPELYWHEGAWHKKLTLTLPKAELFDGSVGVTISDLTTQSGKITFTPDQRTHTYIWGLYAETDQYGGGYRDITNSYLKGDETHWQWFTTSEVAADLRAVTWNEGAEGVQVLYLESYFKALTPGLKYHLVVNAMGSVMNEETGDIEADPSKQNFKHYEFELKNYTLPQPELTVTPVEAYSPWKVKFNVKNPNWRNNPITSACYAANYSREFTIYMSQYNYSYTDIVSGNAGNADFYLSQEDIDMINSDAGAEIEFDTSENSAFTAVFLAWNSEGRPTNPNSTTSPGYAEAHSLPITPAEPLDMTNINDLKGVWTATASVKMVDATTGEHGAAIPMSWKVTIGDLSVSESFTEAQYATLEANGVSRERADAQLLEYNQAAAAYNKSVKEQNRVLCTGWNMSNEAVFNYASPFSLLTSDSYFSSAIDPLFLDFGPKWFLQVNKDGGVFVPVHSERIPVLSNCTGSTLFLCGANYDIKTFFATHPNEAYKDNVEAAGFPVTISEDKNTVTINHYEPTFVDDKGNEVSYPFYPNVIYDMYGTRYIYDSHIVSDVVLTRGWTEPSTPVAPTTQSLHGKPATAASEATFVAPKRPYSKTMFVPNPKKAKVITAKQPTTADFEKGWEKINKKFGICVK